jgi:hypothetical protein
VALLLIIAFLFGFGIFGFGLGSSGSSVESTTVEATVAPGPTIGPPPTTTAPR